MLRPGAGGPQSQRRGAVAAICARGPPPDKCYLAASGFWAGTGQQGGVCTHSVPSREPLGSSRKGFAVSAFGLRRPQTRLERGFPGPPARTLPASSYIVASPSLAVWEAGPGIRSILSAGFGDPALP